MRADVNCLFAALGLDDGGGRLDDDALVPHKNADYARHGGAHAWLNATGRERLTDALATEYWLAERLSRELSRCPGGNRDDNDSRARWLSSPSEQGSVGASASARRPSAVRR
jgi:hypothetical protein